MKDVRTISFFGDVHVFTLTLWGSTIGVNLCFGLFLCIAHNTVFLLFRETKNIYGFKLWGLSPFLRWIISRGITILLKATDFPNNFVAKITLQIPSLPFDLCILSPLCLKQNETVNHSNISEMEKQSFPPSHTFRLGAKCREDLVWPFNSIHFHVVGLKNLRLFYKSLSPFSIRSYSPGHLALFICIAHSCYDGHNLIIYPLQHQTGRVPHPAHTPLLPTLSPLLAVFKSRWETTPA